MKFKNLPNVSYQARDCNLAPVWKALERYLAGYPYFIDKVIWLCEIEHQQVAVFPGSPEDAEEPDIPQVFSFGVPDLWDNEPEDISEDGMAFRKAYARRLRWFKRQIKASFAKANARNAITRHGIDGKLGICLAEYWERLMPAALIYVCGDRLKPQALETPEQMAEWFCAKYDLVEKYALPNMPNVRELYLLRRPTKQTEMAIDIKKLRAVFPQLKVVNLGYFSRKYYPSSLRNQIARTGLELRELTEAEYYSHLERVDGLG